MVLILGAIGLNASQITHVGSEVTAGIRDGLSNPNVGFVKMLKMFLFAYSLGAGTYTGIEAVSNSMTVMREPRVATGQRTMLYMAVSLAVTAGGLLVAYLLLHIQPTADKTKTLNQLLTEAFVGELGQIGRASCRERV